MYKLLSLEKAIFIINCDIFLYTTYFFSFNCLIKLCYLQKVNAVTKKCMIDQLTKARVKFNPNDVLFVTKDKTGQFVWLEKGNKGVGLEHILHGDGRSMGQLLISKKL